ncbi:MAG: hypothetical protein JWL60_1130, partial [Gemmatimonadetes bacterium]|nr:hypothetical protein [Gemmatimonadota bacterium]
MADVVKLKKRAAEYELKKQFDKALATYVEILQSYGRKSDDEVDLSLYNRVGDLYLKQGNVADAVDYYEQAVDRYAEGGFFNNAIALCNKILRSAPGRASVYYKLGKISALKGFKGDAKANFLEYADRMQQSGKIDEAFRALKEFADLCPDQDDIRLMLADQLTKKGRGPEAVEQLQTLYERYTSEGRDTEARATRERMQAIDPSSQPREAGEVRRPAAGDLVFLDLGTPSTPVAPAPPAPPVVKAPPSPAPPKVPDEVKQRATQGLDIIDSGDEPEPAPAPAAHAPAPPPPGIEPEPVIDVPEEVEMVELDMYEPDDMTRTVDFGSSASGSGSLLEGLETTGFVAPDDASSGSLLDIEPTSFAEPEPEPEP